MFAFPFFVISVVRRPEWLSGPGGLGYNIAVEGERTGTVAILTRAFGLETPEPPAGDARRPGEEGA